MDQLRILVVDDNRINRLYLKTILTQWQHHVTEVNSGQSALNACQQQDFNLILMDIRMQPMDGVTAAEKIKQLEHHSETPIVAVSAEHIDCAPYPQFVQALVKPISKQRLRQLINEYLTNSHVAENHSNPFDEDQALAISHHDREIVQKLRSLFVKKLPEEIKEIEQLHKAELWQDLENKLHYLQGSARVCAATTMCENLKQYRQHLSDKSFDDLDACLMNLKDIATEILALKQSNNS